MICIAVIIQMKEANRRIGSVFILGVLKRNRFFLSLRSSPGTCKCCVILESLLGKQKIGVTFVRRTGTQRLVHYCFVREIAVHSPGEVLA